MNHCFFCQLDNFKSHIIQEFEHAYWIISKNQYYEGYSILVSKQHIREWHEVPEKIASSINQNLRFIAAKIQEKLQPRKINLASLGNAVEHLHWHIIPRYLSDPHHMQAPNFSLPDSLTPELFEKLRRLFV
jgi:diadenosine tetraphosphate (Ap4A) HIT family hydrolase